MSLWNFTLAWRTSITSSFRAGLLVITFSQFSFIWKYLYFAFISEGYFTAVEPWIDRTFHSTFQMFLKSADSTSSLFYVLTSTSGSPLRTCLHHCKPLRSRQPPTPACEHDHGHQLAQLSSLSLPPGPQWHLPPSSPLAHWPSPTVFFRAQCHPLECPPLKPYCYYYQHLYCII